MAKGKAYDEDFKKMIVELYNNKKPACEILREYGISSSVLYKWVKELSRTKEELEILKKAIAIFTQK